jgi:glyoxylase-like metal-dependent hydrolase (beta-lactamase superfamily II)
MLCCSMADPSLRSWTRVFPDKASLVFDAIRQLGRTTRDLRHLIFTHGHPDHIGSAAALVRETGATTYMHALDALSPKLVAPSAP